MSWVVVEWLIKDFAVFTLLIFTKVFPIVSIWEVKEGWDQGTREMNERFKSYLPGGQEEQAA